ncbi:MAG: hypothetical protein J0I77_11890 [Rudaea sp.]|nr:MULTISPECIES: hypothetical protein [unclassified Rudaea]MBN8886414.1 hypothetical protein [Rudaea sp.]MBR0346905.1 hypothetical protein [Rudaea sp.]
MGLLSRIFRTGGNSADTDAAPRRRQPIAGELPWRADASVPIVDWPAAHRQMPSGADADDYWWSVALGWLDALRIRLGPQYAIEQSDSFAMLSSLQGRTLQLAMACCERYRRRILRDLDGIATAWGRGPHVVLIFDALDEYYDYVGNYYPQQGEFAMSSGMFIHHGYGHFVFQASEMAAMEPVIAHELTHCLLAMLPIPAWLNEGTAVNMEQALAPRSVDPRRGIFSHRETAQKRTAFWNAETIQQFWSGKSFKRPDEGCSLSYELATEMTLLIAKDPQRYRAFMNSAHWKDAGQDAATQTLGYALEDVAAAVLGDGPWRPEPAKWIEGTELGQF